MVVLGVDPLVPFAGVRAPDSFAGDAALLLACGIPDSLPGRSWVFGMGPLLPKRGDAPVVVAWSFCGTRGEPPFLTLVTFPFTLAMVVVLGSLLGAALSSAFVPVGWVLGEEAGFPFNLSLVLFTCALNSSILFSPDIASSLVLR